jgi:hypothetical protein
MPSRTAAPVSSNTSCPVAASQHWTRPSRSLVATRCPSGLNIAPTRVRWPYRVSVDTPRLTSQMRAVPSRLALTRRVPSELKATLQTASSCPARVLTTSPLRTSQMRMGSPRAWLAVARGAPSGLNATLVRGPVWPVNVYTFWPVVEFQSWAVPSGLAAISRVPSGLNASATTCLREQYPPRGQFQPQHPTRAASHLSRQWPGGCRPY